MTVHRGQHMRGIRAELLAEHVRMAKKLGVPAPETLSSYTNV